MSAIVNRGSTSNYKLKNVILCDVVLRQIGHKAKRNTTFDLDALNNPDILWRQVLFQFEQLNVCDSSVIKKPI